VLPAAEVLTTTETEGGVGSVGGITIFNQIRMIN